MNENLKEWLLFVVGLGLAMGGIVTVLPIDSSLRVGFGICAILIGGYFLGCIGDNKKEEK